MLHELTSIEDPLIIRSVLRIIFQKIKLLQFLLMSKQQDSFEEYRKYLQDSIGVTGIKAPPRPMSPYQRYMYQRVCQQKAKGNNKMSEVNKQTSEQWKKISQSKKQYYNKTYEIRMRQREDLQKQYEILTQKKKPISGYVLFFKQRYQFLKQSSKELNSAELNRRISEEWKNKSMSQKQTFNKQAAEQNALCQLAASEREDRIEDYNHKINEFQEELKQEKQKIMKKYGLDNKKNEKIMEKKKKRQEKQRQKQEKRRELKQQKTKQKEQKSRKLKKEGDNIRVEVTKIKKQAKFQRELKKELKNLKAQLKIEVKIEPTPIRITRSRR